MLFLCLWAFAAAAQTSGPASCSSFDSDEYAGAGWPASHPVSSQPGWSWSPGNHRFVIRVARVPASGVVTVVVPWRRHDTDPEQKDAFIVSAQSHLRVERCTRLSADGESGAFTFSPDDGPGMYHLYYMPFTTCELGTGSCPYGANSVYDKFDNASSCPGGTTWGRGSQGGSAAAAAAVANADAGTDATDGGTDVADADAVTVRGPQGRSYFARFTDMELAATAAETRAIVAAARGGEDGANDAGGGAPAPAPVTAAAILVTEGRERPIRMRKALPARWAARQPAELRSLSLAAQPGEGMTFQLAVHVPAEAAAGIVVRGVTFSGFGGLDVSSMHCMNLNGTDWLGRPYRPAVAPLVRVGQVLPLWVSVDVPLDAKAGSYAGDAVVAVTGATASSSTADTGAVQLHATITLNISGAPLADAGDSQGWRGTRLRWLDSTLGQGGDVVPSPYQPLNVSDAGGGAVKTNGTRVTMLDKEFVVGADGLPRSVVVGTAASLHPTSNAVEAQALGSTSLDNTATGTVAQGVVVGGSVDGRRFSSATASDPGAATFTLVSTSAAKTEWRSSWQADAQSGLQVAINGSLDFSGYADFVVEVRNGGSNPIGELAFNLTVPNAESNAHMAMGLGVAGGYLDEIDPDGGTTERSEWLVLDLGRPVSADALALYGAGDGVHDAAHVRVQVGAAVDGPWEDTAELHGKGGAAKQVLDFPNATAPAQFWRLLFLSQSPSPNCQPASSCQVWLGELQLRDAASGTFVTNAGTSATDSIVKASSGSSSITNAAWKAADGVLGFIQDAQGWDAADKPLPDPPGPSPPPTPAALPPIVWRWDGINGNNAVWVGSSAAGLRLFLKGDEDMWQAAVPFDSRATPPAPPSWSNAGAGGIELTRSGRVTAFTGGGRGLAANDALTFRFSLLATPVRPLDLRKHFGERYAQLGGPANYTFLAEQGATVANMHQGNGINPWINYPYLTNSLMRDAAQQCHAAGLKFKIYNTMRELSNRNRELFAMMALNETFTQRDDNIADPGALPDVTHGADWLQEHLQVGYSTAWSNPVTNLYPGSDEQDAPSGLDKWVFHPFEQDAAIKVVALSRWNNYYVQGLKQMVADFDFDGLYLDEIAYDRTTMMRAKAVLGEAKLIDHHADKGGFTPSPAANYLELFPFIDSLWYGEGFDYDGATPAYWLLEMSGVALGLNADMLRYAGMTPKHFHGMLFGNANRWQCALNQPTGTDCPFDPRDVWKLWADFGIAEAKMYGWWLARERGAGAVPVTCSDPGVRVTTFARGGASPSALISVASFLKADVNVTLSFDWSVLGLDASSAVLSAPALVPMQPKGRAFAPTDMLPVPAGQGWLLVLK